MEFLIALVTLCVLSLLFIAGSLLGGFGGRVDEEPYYSGLRGGFVDAYGVPTPWLILLFSILELIPITAFVCYVRGVYAVFTLLVCVFGIILAVSEVLKK